MDRPGLIKVNFKTYPLFRNSAYLNARKYDKLIVPRHIESDNRFYFRQTGKTDDSEVENNLEIVVRTFMVEGTTNNWDERKQHSIEQVIRVRQYFEQLLNNPGSQKYFWAIPEEKIVVPKTDFSYMQCLVSVRDGWNNTGISVSYILAGKLDDVDNAYNSLEFELQQFKMIETKNKSMIRKARKKAAEREIQDKDENMKRRILFELKCEGVELQNYITSLDGIKLEEDYMQLKIYSVPSTTNVSSFEMVSALEKAIANKSIKKKQYLSNRLKRKIK
jgi:hypothetical protein